MNNIPAKSSLILSLLVFFSFHIKAQQNHFIYLQTENKQPFYIKLDKKLFSSSGSGYLIVPKLVDGVYRLSIGFPKNEWPEQQVTCLVDKKDAGYLLKNLGDKGWGLFNLQTMEMVMAGKNTTTATTPVVKESSGNNFSDILSDVVDDPSIRKKEPAKEVAKSEANEDTKQAVKDESKPIVKEEKKPTKKTPAKEKENNKSNISKLLDNTTTEGTEMVFVDLVNGIPDTIRLLIPADKINPGDQSPIKKEESNIKEPEKEIVVKEEQKKEEPKKEEPKIEEVKKEAVKNEAVNKEEPKKEEAIKDEPKKENVIKEEPTKEKQKKSSRKKEDQKKDGKFLDIELPNPNSTSHAELKQEEKKSDNVMVTEKPATTNNAKPVMINSDCKKNASEDDFLKLRKKMAVATDDEGMMIAARKGFKTRCFTTDQVKNLSVLFLKDDGKYKFFDLAYPFVTDSQNFPSLETQLTDPYFINRFKVMIRH